MKKVNINEIYKILVKETRKYKTPFVELMEIRTKNPFNVLIATILSARTNDKTTARVVVNLFSKIKNVDDLSRLSIKQIESLIKSINYYKTKARNLKKLAIMLKKEYNGKVPKDVDELVKLPGVGRKTANLVSSSVFGKDEVYVDTHVHRITNRWGYVKTKTPVKTEIALRKKLPKKYWRKISNILVVYGQNICKPQIPLCSVCKIKKYCNKIGVTKSK